MKKNAFFLIEKTDSVVVLGPETPLPGGSRGAPKHPENGPGTPPNPGPETPTFFLAGLAID